MQHCYTYLVQGREWGSKNCPSLPTYTTFFTLRVVKRKELTCFAARRHLFLVKTPSTWRVNLRHHLSLKSLVKDYASAIRWHIPQNDRCGDNGASSLFGGTRSLPVGPVKVVRLSGCSFSSSGSEQSGAVLTCMPNWTQPPGPGVGWGAFMSAPYFSVVASESGHPLTAGSGESTPLEWHRWNKSQFVTLPAENGWVRQLFSTAS